MPVSSLPRQSCEARELPAWSGGQNIGGFTPARKLRQQGLHTDMAGVLLALFLVLILFNTRAAMVVLAIAIVLLYRKRVSTPRRAARHPDAWD
jgi:hypothetical protein